VDDSNQLRAAFSGQTREFIRHATLIVFSSCAVVIVVHYGIELVQSITSTVVSDSTTNGCPLK